MEIRHLEPGGERSDSTTVTSTVLLGLSTIIILLRLYTRMLIVRNPGRDDFMIVVAWVFIVGNLVCIWILASNKMGYSQPEWPNGSKSTFVRTTIATEVLYYSVVKSIKISIVFFYQRFQDIERFFALSCKYTIVLLVLFWSIEVLVVTLQCIPMDDLWDFLQHVGGRCINATIFHYFASGFNVATDIWLLTLPLKTLWGIPRPPRQNFALCFTFGLGILTLIAAVVRLHSIHIFTESHDPSTDIIPINIWSSVEINVGVYCASIPSLKAMFFKSGPAPNHSRRMSLRPKEPKHSARPVEHKRSSSPSLSTNRPGLYDITLVDTPAVAMTTDMFDSGVEDERHSQELTPRFTSSTPYPPTYGPMAPESPSDLPSRDIGTFTSAV